MSGTLPVPVQVLKAALRQVPVHLQIPVPVHLRQVQIRRVRLIPVVQVRTRLHPVRREVRRPHRLKVLLQVLNLQVLLLLSPPPPATPQNQVHLLILHLPVVRNHLRVARNPVQVPNQVQVLTPVHRAVRNRLQAVLNRLQVVALSPQVHLPILRLPAVLSPHRPQVQNGVLRLRAVAIHPVAPGHRPQAPNLREVPVLLQRAVRQVANHRQAAGLHLRVLSPVHLRILLRPHLSLRQVQNHLPLPRRVLNGVHHLHRKAAAVRGRAVHPRILRPVVGRVIPVRQVANLPRPVVYLQAVRVIHPLLHLIRLPAPAQP